MEDLFLTHTMNTEFNNKQGEFKLRVQNLLKIDDEKVSGAMSPVLFAQEACKQLDIRLSGLARVWFDNERTHQAIDENTGYDTLVIMENYENARCLFMFIDGGSSGVPVGMMFNDSDLVLTPIYKNHKNLVKPDPSEIKKVFQYIFDHPETINPVNV